MSSNPHAIVISGLGVHSSLGGIVDAAAAFRCGLSRARELPDWPYFDEETLNEHRLIGHSAAGLSDGFQGLGRLIKMGACALDDMRQYSNLAHLNPARLGFFVVFPTNHADEMMSVDLGKEFEAFLTKLLQLSQIEAEAKNIRTYFEGRIGIISAIQDAIDLLASGKLDHCLIGAIDTLLDTRRLYQLIAENKVKTLDNPKGLVPSEAACFILLEGLSSAKRRGATPEVVVHQPSRIVSTDEGDSEQVSDDNEQVSDDNEQVSDDNEQIPTGDALSKVMIQALDNAKGTPGEKGTIYSDLNGEDFRAADFGSALVRSSSFYSLSDWKLEIPALSFGDIGAVSGILAICLATRAFSRGYFFGDKALVVLSSERGSRGAIVLRRF